MAGQFEEYRRLGGASSKLGRMNYTLRFDRSNIEELARKYTSNQSKKYREAEARIVQITSPATKKNRFYSKADFLEVCRWKSPRKMSYAKKNDEQFIHEVTTESLRTQDERQRITILTQLDGVLWPTASVLLHFGHIEPYPILDFRALWSLSISQPSTYKFSFWSDYVQICRKIAEEFGIQMRMLDRALWQFSKQNQPKSPVCTD